MKIWQSQVRPTLIDVQPFCEVVCSHSGRDWGVNYEVRRIFPFNITAEQSCLPDAQAVSTIDTHSRVSGDFS